MNNVDNLSGTGWPIAGRTNLLTLAREIDDPQTGLVANCLCCGFGAFHRRLQ